jgi:hypothetical protein
MHHPFDEFSKSLADDSVARRESLRRLGAAFVGALLGPLVLGSDIALANPDNRRKRRRQSRQPFRGFGGKNQDACTTFCKKCATKSKRDQCLAACRACSNDPKRLNGACGNYVCCSSGQSYCNAVCVEFKSDPNNCGSCGNVCAAGSTCVNGTCTGATDCPSGQTRCGTVCVNLLTDNNNCGACGYACADPTPYCTGGTCSDHAPCPAGQTWCNGACHNLQNDNTFCGQSCETALPCGQFETCTGGVCVPVDPPSPE